MVEGSEIRNSKISLRRQVLLEALLRGPFSVSVSVSNSHVHSQPTALCFVFGVHPSNVCFIPQSLLILTPSVSLLQEPFVCMRPTRISHDRTLHVVMLTKCILSYHTGCYSQGIRTGDIFKLIGQLATSAMYCSVDHSPMIGTLRKCKIRSIELDPHNLMIP